MKVCTKCKISKQKHCFSKDRAASGGMKFWCKDCVKSYKVANRKQILEQATQYYRENKSEIRKKHAKHYEGNREIIGEKHAKWRKENKDYFKKYRVENMGRVTKQIKKWRKKNPDKLVAYDAKRRATKLNQTPPNANLEKIARIYKESKDISNSTGVLHHVDHIIPLSKGGLHHQDNLQVITARENLRKGSKLY